MGTVIRVSGLQDRYNGTYTVRDTGPSVRGRRLDLYVRDCDEAVRFGSPVREGIRLDHPSQLRRRPQDDGDLRVERLLDGPLDLRRIRRFRTEDDVPALQVRAHILIAQVREQLTQGAHAYTPLVGEIDCAKKGDVARHAAVRIGRLCPDRRRVGRE